jgi:hypothetical protein
MKNFIISLIIVNSFWAVHCNNDAISKQIDQLGAQTTDLMKQLSGNLSLWSQEKAMI